MKIAKTITPAGNIYNSMLAYGNGSLSFGILTGTTFGATHSIVMGSGPAFSTPLINNIASSLMIGFNSDLPTFFVGPASGAGTTGNVGIGTANPLQKLDVNGTGRFGNASGHVDILFNSVHGIIDSDKDLLINYYSQKQTFIGPGDLVVSGRMRVGSKNLISGPHTNYKFAVDGKIVAREIYVTLDNWADFVFDESYKLMPLDEVENYINKNHHLPDVPGAKEMVEKGNNLAQTDIMLLRKIEELMRYIIVQNKKIESLTQEIKSK